MQNLGDLTLVWIRIFTERMKTSGVSRMTHCKVGYAVSLAVPAVLASTAIGASGFERQTCARSFDRSRSHRFLDRSGWTGFARSKLRRQMPLTTDNRRQAAIDYAGSSVNCGLSLNTPVKIQERIDLICRFGRAEGFTVVARWIETANPPLSRSKHVTRITNPLRPSLGLLG